MVNYSTPQQPNRLLFEWLLLILYNLCCLRAFSCVIICLQTNENKNVEQSCGPLNLLLIVVGIVAVCWICIFCLWWLRRRGRGKKGKEGERERTNYMFLSSKVSQTFCLLRSSIAFINDRLCVAYFSRITAISFSFWISISSTIFFNWSKDKWAY